MAFDINNTADLLVLKNEFNADPANVGYAATNGDTAKILDLFNLESSNPVTTDMTPIPFDEFPLIDALDEIITSEYNALNSFKAVKINAIINAGVRDPNLNFGHVKSLFKSAFGNTSETWLKVKDDRLRHASRSEALFGRDTVITRNQWITARES